MSKKKKFCVELDDLTLTSNSKNIFSFGKPSKAKIDKFVMKPPKVLFCQFPPDTLLQEKSNISRKEKRPCQYPPDKLSQEKNLDSGDECDELSEDELLKCLSELYSLEKKEEELKIAILYEKLKKEEHVSDQPLENIDQLQRTLEQTKENLKMRQVYSSKKQQTEILRRIMQPSILKNKSKEEVSEYSDEARKFIENIIFERKEKEKEINLLQKQIKEAEETYLQLRTKIDDFTSTPTKQKMASSAEEELKCLTEENVKRSSRVQLLSNITKALIENISDQDNLKDDLKLLALSCENILNWDSEDLDELKDLCKKVNSTQI